MFSFKIELLFIEESVRWHKARGSAQGRESNFSLCITFDTLPQIRIATKLITTIRSDSNSFEKKTRYTTTHYIYIQGPTCTKSKYGFFVELQKALSRSIKNFFVRRASPECPVGKEVFWYIEHKTTSPRL